MKHLLLATVAVIALLMCQAAQAASDQDYFHACVKQEGNAALRRKVQKSGDDALYGYQNDVANEVFAICKQRAIDSSERIDYPAYVYGVVEALAKAALYEKAKKELEAERKRDELNAPRLKAEKAVEDQAASIYFACLDNHARVLAVKSNEPAEVIAQASFASCRTERQGVFDAYRGHTNSFYPETMAAAEPVFQRQLLLAVIEARASRDAQPSADAMNFTWPDHLTVHASGPIGEGDAAKFAALPKFNTLELDSPGGLVGEALKMAANMDARGGIRTVVRSGSSCASACAMALFVSGETRIVYMGGRVGLHSCAMPDGTQAPECNKAMAANATAHGVPWGVIEAFGSDTKPSSMLWLGAEDAECWGLMKWSASDTSNNGLACFKWGKWTNEKRKPDEVTAENADDVLCRMNAGTSRIYVSTGHAEQGFSDAYRRACERVAADPSTPKYAAVDIIMWLMLTDPNVLALKPGTLMGRILDNDETHVGNCWKCLTILGMSDIMHGAPRDALEMFQVAVNVVKRDTGSVPEWLASRVELAAAEAAKQNR
jgi:hypothetical protein